MSTAAKKTTLRQRVSTYFRQLSFINEPRLQSHHPSNHHHRSECFIRKYLEGRLDEESENPTCAIHSGREPTELPELNLRAIEGGSNVPIIASTGPDKGLLTVRRTKLHLSGGSDIDFIDNNNGLDECEFEVRRSKRANAQRFGGIVARATSTTSPIMTARLNHQVQDEDRVNANEIRLSGLEWNTEQENQATEPFVGVSDWSGNDYDQGCGQSTSLYERNPITKEVIGSPIADCFGIIVHGDACLMALADGVNWGDKACLAARAAIHGSLEYMEGALFGTVAAHPMTSRDVHVSLLRSFWEAHNCILEVGGALTTLTVCAVLPLANGDDAVKQRWIVCACNVGDSLGYVYSQKHGVREFTQASHDTTTARDMRDALGALGPVDGTKPELSNLTLSMTIVDEGDSVFLTSDGISDNFDPVVGKFAEAQLIETPKMAHTPTTISSASAKMTAPNRNARPQSQVISKARQVGHNSITTTDRNTQPRPQYSRSKTVIEPRANIMKNFIPGTPPPVPRSASILPQVTAVQRHKLTLLRLGDLLSYGINGQLEPCKTAKKLCQLLIDFSRMITAAKRAMLEQRETYIRLITDSGGQRRETELNRIQQRAARKRVVDSGNFQALPGKLDHASVVAFTCTRVANLQQPSIESETAKNRQKTDGMIETNF